MVIRARIVRTALLLIALAAPGATPAGNAAASAVDGRWVELGAPARQQHSLIYDAANQRLVLFGGISNVVSNAVYVLDVGVNEWTRLDPAGTPPSPRYGHVAIYDASRQRMLVFGGYDGAPCNDVWALSLDATPTWTQLSPAGAPPPARFRFVGVYDSLRDRLLVHGGDSGAGALDDLWALSFAGGGAWSSVAPVGPAPAARAQHAGIYDPVRDRLLIFGGSGTGSTTWAFDCAAQTWDSLTTSGGPPLPRTAAAGVYDPLHDAFLVIGGFEGFLPVADTWALSLGGAPTWTSKASPGRYGLAACWVPDLNGAVAHGGYNQSFTHTSTELLDTGLYSSVTTLEPGGPWLRRQSRGILDPVRNRLVIYGGDAASGFDPNPTATTLSMAAGSGYAWTVLAQTVPYHRISHSLIYDSAGDRMILYAGDGVYGSSQWLDDTWSFDLATDAWTELTFTGPIPGFHEGHTAIYDPAGERMVVFGGIVNGDFSDELWQLDLVGTPAWSPLVASGAPPAPRSGHAAVYDPVGHRMLVFGGSGAFTWPDPLPGLNDVWELTLGASPAWRQLAPDGDPPDASYGALWEAVCDPVRSRVIVFGPGAPRQLVLTDPPQWAPLVTTGPAPTGVPGQPLVYDPDGDRLLVFGANFSDATLALELEPVGTVSVAPTAAAPRFAVSRVSPNPARGSLSAVLELPRAGTVTLELHDLAGRRIAARESATLPAGRHTVTLRVPAAAAPGVYFLRAAFDGEFAAAKVALVR